MLRSVFRIIELLRDKKNSGGSGKLLHLLYNETRVMQSAVMHRENSYKEAVRNGIMVIQRFAMIQYTLSEAIKSL